ncbi:type IX secretion system outer membrane channel protein PorV [Leptobacterium flavescens]|uniref:Type IX secretion system outer membrane channel protein PorV n=1 Tax=Leptobacterium flavescens TaxID=472055 RepID=A0A6P0UNP3_9FLAO|nr:type IX secretion system outer membrane channel protein PorV [Leptobacterium flavescens]NER15001.1 type IX secretion system outer membrane channel protein PorV [Leptobacterium flavescens]
MKKILFSFVLLALVINQARAQEEQSRVITTAVPFLLIAGDARASGTGDVGVATSPDAYSQQWNPAKYVFAKKQIGIGVSYTPFLAELVNDISLLQANFYKRNERSAFAFSLRYFGLGEIELRQNANDPGEIVKPNEFAFDGSYSLKLSDRFSMAVAGRYIRSNLRLQQVDANAQAGTTFAVDVAGYYQSEEIAYNNFDGRWRFGFNISNIGPKISYDEGGQENFIPTNLKFGGGFDFIFDESNKLAISTEFNKLLVPTPRDFDNDGDIDAEDNEEYQNISFFSGIFESFGDAPDGFSEELKEFTWALGAEYVYQDAFALRAGYFNESEDKGARKFFTLGAGFQFKAATIDVSYLFSSSSVRNPLENTLRFSLTFNLGNDFLEF